MYEYLNIIYLSRLTVALHGIGEWWSSPQPVCFLELKESDYINGGLNAFWIIWNSDLNDVLIYTESFLN